QSVRELANASKAVRAYPRASVQARERRIATATADARGFYYLAGPTRTSSAAARVQAVSSERLTCTLTVTLPREPAALDDLVLAPAETVPVRVLDLDGRAVPGATVWSPENPLPQAQARTDAQGVLVYTAPLLPASFSATSERLWMRELRLDGVAVPAGTRV